MTHDPYGMLLLFFHQNRFLINIVSLTKYTRILSQLIGNLNLKIIYNAAPAPAARELIRGATAGATTAGAAGAVAAAVEETPVCRSRLYQHQRTQQRPSICIDHPR